MTYHRPDHRRVLHSVDFGWPAETITTAEAEYDAQMRSRQPDDPGIPVHAVGDTEARDDFDRHALRGPVHVIRDDDDAPMVIAYLFGAIVGLAIVVAAALAWGL